MVSKKEGLSAVTVSDATYIKRQSPRAIHALISHNTHQRLTVLEKTGLERDDDELHAWSGVFADVLRQLCCVRVVERGVDFV